MAGMQVSRVADTERCYRAVQSRDRRFDGIFYTAVRTTGIYCRPSCPARTPHRTSVDFFVSAAAAQVAGYRACRRCLPDATPGSPDWDVRADTAGRAMRLINDGVVEREGVAGLARRIGYTPRHLGRLLTRGGRRRPARPRPRASGPRPPGSWWRRPRCRWPTSRSPPASPACGSSTRPWPRSTPSRRRRCAAAGGPAASRRRGAAHPAGGPPPFDGPELLGSSRSAPCRASRRSTDGTYSRTLRAAARPGRRAPHARAGRRGRVRPRGRPT